MDPPQNDATDVNVGADKKPPPTPTNDVLADALWTQLSQGMQLNVHRRLRSVEQRERNNADTQFILKALFITIFLLQLVTLVIALRK